MEEFDERDELALDPFLASPMMQKFAKTKRLNFQNSQRMKVSSSSSSFETAISKDKSQASYSCPSLDRTFTSGEEVDGRIDVDTLDKQNLPSPSLFKRTVSGLSTTVGKLTSCGSSVASVTNCATPTRGWDDERTDNSSNTISTCLDSSDLKKNSNHVEMSTHVRKQLQKKLIMNPSMKKVFSDGALTTDLEDDFVVISKSRSSERRFKSKKSLKRDELIQTPSISLKEIHDKEMCIKKNRSRIHHWGRSKTKNKDSNTEERPELSPVEPQYIQFDDETSTEMMTTIDASWKLKELDGTYTKYRMKQKYLTEVLDNVHTVLPKHFELENHNTKNDNHKLLNAASEPHGNTFNVRGPTYCSGGPKMKSSESMFALLGVDHIFRNEETFPASKSLNSCELPESFRERLKKACSRKNIQDPFLLVFNLALPWGNIIAHMYRPDATKNEPFNQSKSNEPSEKLWKTFMSADEKYRNKKFKMIPRIIQGPWMVKKLVKTVPVLIGQKIPVSYYGSYEERYLEITLDITRGGKFANSIVNTCAGAADSITVDMGFLIEGSDSSELPELMLGAFRLHHVDMKKNNGFTNETWHKELLRRQLKRGEE